MYSGSDGSGNWVRTDFGWRILPGDAETGESWDGHELSTFALTRARSRQTTNKESKTLLNNDVRLSRIPGANRPHDGTCQERCDTSELVRQPRLTGIKGIASERRAPMGLSAAIESLEVTKVAVETSGILYCSELFGILLSEKVNKMSGTTQRQILQVLADMVSEAMYSEANVVMMKRLLRKASDGLDDTAASCAGSKRLWQNLRGVVNNLTTQVQAFQYTQREEDGLPNLLDLPKECLYKILGYLSHPSDLASVGASCSYLRDLATDPLLWQHMCLFHFSDKQLYPYIDDDEYTGIDWLTAFKCCYRKHKQLKISYTNDLSFCNLCRAVFWSSYGHPCFNPEEDPSSSPLVPREFIAMFTL